MADHAAMKLGKLEPKDDPRTLKLEKYLDLSQLPPLPKKGVGWDNDPSGYGYMGNDRIGDCTCAAVGHQVQVWSKNTGQEVTIPDSAIIAAYSAVSGYDPQTGANDNGAYELDVLNLWRKQGVGGHRCAAFADVNPKHHDMVKYAIWLFGGVYIGVALPISAQQQNVWKPAGGASGQPGSWGGHAVVVVDWSKQYLWCITWGGLKAMTWGFWSKYVDEAHVVLGPEWTDGTKQAPSGFDLAALQADLQAVTA